MDDRELEALLNKYRPVDPSASLEDRIFQSPDPEAANARAPRTWPWVAAAAALLAITVSLQAGARTTPAVDPTVQAAAQELMEASGGDQQSRAIAEWTLTVAQRLSEGREPERTESR